MSEELNKTDKKSKKKTAAGADMEISDLDAALSASIDDFYKSDFTTDASKSVQEKKAFEETTIIEPVKEISEKEFFELPESEAEAVPKIDEDVFRDVDTALAGQIDYEIKKSKKKRKKNRKKYPKWWLLALIPVIGILVLFIDPLRRHMPKWFMALRTLVFMTFAAAVFSLVATDGMFTCAVGVKTVKNKFGTKLERQPDLTNEFSNIVFDTSSRLSSNKITFLCVVRDLEVSDENEMLALVSTDSNSGTMSIYFFDDDTELDSVKENVDGWFFIDSRVVSVIVEKMGGIELVLNKAEAEFINSRVKNSNLRSGRQTITGSEAAAYFLCDVATDKSEAGNLSKVEHQKETIKLINTFMEEKSIHGRFFVLRDCVPYVTTDLSENLLVELLAQKTYKLSMSVSARYSTRP